MANIEGNNVIAFPGLSRPARHALSESDDSYFSPVLDPQAIPEQIPAESTSDDLERGSTGRWWLTGAVTALLLLGGCSVPVARGDADAFFLRSAMPIDLEPITTGSDSHEQIMCQHVRDLSLRTHARTCREG
jgi:hypothetical protein